MYSQVETPEQEMLLVNTIDYDMKLFQIKTTVVIFMYVWIKGLKFISHRRKFGIANMNVMLL